MGSPPGERERHPDEEQHEVKITRPFYLGISPVTQQQYETVARTNPSHFGPTGGGRGHVRGLRTADLPVESVSWEGAVAFCARLSELPAEREAGRVYRLPTEAEWEYSCRAGTTTTFHFGPSLSAGQANFNGQHPYGATEGPYLERTSPVGLYPPNALGLWDMHGNVWEWCQDWYHEAYYRETPRADPRGPASGSRRVLRGGGWYSYARNCRSANRRSYGTIDPSCIGFRVVMVPGGLQ
jgi:formylglycine-generating enzyme required for sulfatase activity